MKTRFWVEMKNDKKFSSIDLWNQILQFNPNLMEVGSRIFITGCMPYSHFSTILERCLAFGDAECSIRQEKER